MYILLYTSYIIYTYIGLVTNEGQYPIAGGSVRNVLASGPMCRHAEDLLPLLNILAQVCQC